MRALVLGDDFWANVAMLSLPLLVIISISLGIYRSAEALPSEAAKSKGSTDDR